MKFNKCMRCCLLYTSSIRTNLPWYAGKIPAKAGLSIPLILPTNKVAPVNKAPELPAEIKTSPSPFFNMLNPTTIEESFLFLIATVGVSSILILSLIHISKVKVIRDETGLATDYEIEGDYPKYGNDDDRADQIGVELVKRFLSKLQKHYTYRNSTVTLSVLTITSNVVYGKNTGNTPDGRRMSVSYTHLTWVVLIKWSSTKCAKWYVGKPSDLRIWFGYRYS